MKRNSYSTRKLVRESYEDAITVSVEEFIETIGGSRLLELFNSVKTVNEEGEFYGMDLTDEAGSPNNIKIGMYMLTCYEGDTVDLYPVDGGMRMEQSDIKLICDGVRNWIYRLYHPNPNDETYEVDFIGEDRSAQEDLEEFSTYCYIGPVTEIMNNMAKRYAQIKRMRSMNNESRNRNNMNKANITIKDINEMVMSTVMKVLKEGKGCCEMSDPNEYRGDYYMDANQDEIRAYQKHMAKKNRTQKNGPKKMRPER